MSKHLVKNSVKCLACGEVLVSKHRHHYVQCKCPNQTACDGGLVYQRVLGEDLDLIENLAEYKEGEMVYSEQEPFSDSLFSMTEFVIDYFENKDW